MKIKPDRCSMNVSRMSWKDWIDPVQFPNVPFDYCSHEISVGESLSLQIKPSELFGTLMKYLPLWVLPCSGLASVAGFIYCHSLLLFAWPFVGAVKIDQKLVCHATENAVPQCDTKPVFLQTTCITGVKALILAEVALRSGHSVVRCVALTPLWLWLFSASAYRETSMEFLSKPVLRRFLSVRVDFH